MDHAITHRQALIGKRPKLADKIKPWLGVIVLFAAWAYVSEMDYQDAVASQSQRSACWSK